MGLTEINNLEIEDCLYIIAERFACLDSIVIDSEYDGNDWYERIALSEEGITNGFEIPAMEVFEEDFEAYKLELTIAENARLAELDRIADLESRYSVISMRDAGMPAFYALKTDTPNAHKFMNDLIKDSEKSEEAESFMVELEAKDLEILTAQNKTSTLTNLYNSMVNDVYNEMENVFGTRNDASATANASTWEAMKSRPESYLSSNLGFLTADSVTIYATIKLAEADAYGVFRLERIAQFTLDKIAIG